MPQPLASASGPTSWKNWTPPLELPLNLPGTKALILKHLTQFKGPRPHQAGGSMFNDVDGWNFTGKQFGYKTPFKTGKPHTHTFKGFTVFSVSTGMKSKCQSKRQTKGMKEWDLVKFHGSKTSQAHVSARDFVDIGATWRTPKIHVTGFRLR